MLLDFDEFAMLSLPNNLCSCRAGEELQYKLCCCVTCAVWNPLSWAMEVAAILAIILLDYADFALVGLAIANG